MNIDFSTLPAGLNDEERALGFSISDDDLCADCCHLIYYPGDLSLCSRLTLQLS